MNDVDIIRLFLERNEKAIICTKTVYGKRIRHLAYQITEDFEVSEECENDTYLKAWDSIPPHEPYDYFYPFLVRITRHIALNICRNRKALKRKASIIMLITNLCDNAKKAHATKITVKLNTEGIWVKDNGKGIAKEELDHIFEAFYQGDISRNQEGFGLGLTLCQEIAKIHHTTLYVESEIGKGSTFYLYNSFTTL